jgi:signal peptidase II
MDERAPIPRRRHFAFWALAALCLTADLWSKHWMFAQPDLLAGQVKWIWTGHLGFQLSLNEGALFGMGQGNVWLFATFSIAAATAIPLWLFVWGGARDRALTLVLACVLGGVLGNLYDRVGLPGLDWSTLPTHLDHQADAGADSHRSGRVYAVRDFILGVRHWPPRDRWDIWPNFNIADSLLVCGAGALLLLSLRRPQSAEPSEPAAPTAS